MKNFGRGGFIYAFLEEEAYRTYIMWKDAELATDLAYYFMVEAVSHDSHT